MLESHTVAETNGFENKFDESDLIFMGYSGNEKLIYNNLSELRNAIGNLTYNDYDITLSKQQDRVNKNSLLT